MKKILILIPFFGKWPPWIDLYIQTCRSNPTIDWIFFTDCGTPDNVPPNVKFINMTFRAFRGIVSEKLGVVIPGAPYKLCDIKPALGDIFREHIKGYDFLGYGDIDVVYGDLRKFLDADRLEHDVISFHKNRVSGHLVFFRNSEEVLKVYREVPSWREKMASEKNEILDELGIYPAVIKMKSFFCEAHTTPHKNNFWKDGSLEFPEEWYWSNGAVYNGIDGECHPYFHFKTWKKQPGGWLENGDYKKSLEIADHRHIPYGFMVTGRGFTALTGPWQKRLKKRKTLARIKKSVKNMAVRSDIVYPLYAKLRVGLKYTNALTLGRLFIKNAFSRKIKVGFGPLICGNRTLSSRSFVIDPIVEHINKNDYPYICDTFAQYEDLRRFDILVMVKSFDDMSPKRMKWLKDLGIKTIFNICDNPGTCGYYKDYLKEKWFTDSLDGVIAVNPLQVRDAENLGLNVRLIPLPFINTVKKKKGKSDGTRIIWQGNAINMPRMRVLDRIVEQIARDTGKDVNLLYNSDIAEFKGGNVYAEKWNIKKWQSVLAECDIGVEIKPADDHFQQRKASEKIQSYMAAGLCVVCSPSAADMNVIEHGKTGFFARSDREWYEILKALVLDRELLSVVSRAGMESVSKDYSVEKVADMHVRFFDDLIKLEKKI